MSKNNSKNVSSQAMDNRKTAVKMLIDDVVSDLEQEIELHKKGTGTDASIPVLSEILGELNQMKAAMSPGKYLPTYNYIIRDSWGMFPRLGEKLLKVSHEYKEKLG
ncbi:hypothetical protein NSQ26_04700 [Bacillus sp. FSL W7-1360]